MLRPDPATKLRLKDVAAQALAELEAAFAHLPEHAAEELMEAILGARRIALHGCGREGLQMRGFAMRLYHLGLEPHVVSDMTTPPLGPGDLLFVSAGPGTLATVEALMVVARRAGAKVGVITAQPGGACSTLADFTTHLPAQTMADDRGAATSVLPMGSLFETMQMVFFELVILLLRERLGESAESMRARHTNLE